MKTLPHSSDEDEMIFNWDSASVRMWVHPLAQHLTSVRLRRVKSDAADAGAQ